MDRNPVTQNHSLGCGVACVAFVANKSYSEIIEKFVPHKAKSEGLYCKEIVLALKGLGLIYEYKYIKPKVREKVYIEDSIVFIKRSNSYPAGHYLVRHGKGWMDPWINFKKDSDVENAKSGFRKRLPGQPIYVIYQI